MNYLFIVGCPRSGTTWIAWLLAQHPEVVVSLHSGFVQALDRAIGELERPSRFGNRVLAGHGTDRLASLTELVPREELMAASRPLLETLLGGAARADDRTRWVVEKTPENLLHTDLIRGALPEARFLHIVRDPRAVFASMRSALKQWAYPGDLPTSPTGFARQAWLRYLGEADRLEREIPDRYMAIRYEDLSQEGPVTLSRVFDWLGLEASSKNCSDIVEAGSLDRMRAQMKAPRGFFRRGTPDGWRDELPRRPIRIIEHLAGERMQELGYDCLYPSTGRTPLALRVSDGLTAVGRRVARGRLAGPMRWVVGRALRTARTVRDLMTDS